MTTEKLFSYATLQYEAVQLANFGRKLEGAPDTLTEFKMSMLEINDPKFIAISGMTEHPIIIYTGNMTDKVEGVVFDVSAAELECADAYTECDYKRIKVKLASGVWAWVYVGLDHFDEKMH